MTSYVYTSYTSKLRVFHSVDRIKDLWRKMSEYLRCIDACIYDRITSYLSCQFRRCFISNANIWFTCISASVTGHRDIGVSLLQSGADINAQDKDGKTALMLSILNGHQALLEVLLKKNANVKLKNEVRQVVIRGFQVILLCTSHLNSDVSIRNLKYIEVCYFKLRFKIWSKLNRLIFTMKTTINLYITTFVFF